MLIHESVSRLETGSGAEGSANSPKLISLPPSAWSRILCLVTLSQPAAPCPIQCVGIQPLIEDT